MKKIYDPVRYNELYDLHRQYTFARLQDNTYNLEENKQRMKEVLKIVQKNYGGKVAVRWFRKGPFGLEKILVKQGITK